MTPRPIADRQDVLDILWGQLGEGRAERADTGFNGPEREGDDVVRQRMFAATNGPKVRDLHDGNWQKHYPPPQGSQSQADFALIDMIAFYTDNREQCARIFNTSALGARNKQTTIGGVPYVEHMVAKVFSEKLPRLDHSAVISQLQALTTAARKPGRFTFMTGAAICALQPSLDVIKDVLPGKGLVVGYGRSTGGKSFLFFDMGAHIAEGRDWWGRRTKQRRVFYLALEGGAGFRKRVAAWQKVNDRDLPADMGIAFDPLDLTNPDDVAALAAECPDDVVVFVDTLSRASGGADENSPLGMGQILAGVAAFQRLKPNSLVFLIAHPGKDPTRGLRGHNSLFAACDAVIFVNREGDQRSWELEKAKDGEDGIKHGFKLRVVDLGEDEDGDSITSCVVVPDSASCPQWAYKPLSPNKHLAMASFHEAVGEHGIVDDDGNFFGLNVEAWRTVFYRSSTSDNDSKRKAFGRARSDLVRHGHLVVENDHYRMGGPNAVAQNAVIAATLIAKRDSGTTAGQSRDSPDASSGTGRDTTL